MTLWGDPMPRSAPLLLSALAVWAWVGCSGGDSEGFRECGPDETCESAALGGGGGSGGAGSGQGTEEPTDDTGGGGDTGDTGAEE